MPTWNNNSGDWHTAANWTGGVPNGNASVANFTNATNGGFVQVGILENTSITIGSINVNLTGSTDLSIRGSLNDSGSGFGTLYFNNGSQLGDSIVTINTLIGGGEFEISGFGGLRVDLGPGATSFNVVNAGTVARINAQIINDGILVKEGDGILSLGSNNSSWTGGISILDGVLQATTASGALGTGNIHMGGGALRAAFTVANGISVGSAGGSILAATGSTLTLTGSLQNANGGILTLGSAGDAGTIIANQVGAVGATGNSGINIAGGTVRIENSNVAFALLNRNGGIGLSEIQSGATLDTRGFETSIANLDLDGGTIRTSTGTLNLRIDDKSASTISQSGTIVGTAGVDQIRVDVANGFSLNGVTFSNWTAGTDMINIYGSAANNGITGSTLNDLIAGYDGNDTLFGNGGVDQISGGDGNDIIIVNGANSGSSVYGDTPLDPADTGFDTLRVVNGTFQTSPFVGGLLGFEALELVGGATIRMGTDNYDDGFAADSTISGNGTMIIDMGFDSDTFNGGHMTVQAGSSINTTINGGNKASGSDVIKGIRGATNTINGNAGIDLLVGGDMADIINGGSETDKIKGMGGADILTGGSGADVFKFRAISDSGLGANADIITDFVSGEDKLNFGRIDTDPNIAGDQGFGFVGTGAFTGGGVASIRYVDLGNDLRVEADVNGDGIADMHVLLQGAGLQTLNASDFVL